MPWNKVTQMEELNRFVILARADRFTLTALCLRINYADQSLPSDGPYFNFPVISGFEWEQRGENGNGWSFGVRWFHLSNANLIEGNAGYDGVVFRVERRVEW